MTTQEHKYGILKGESFEVSGDLTIAYEQIGLFLNREEPPMSEAKPVPKVPSGFVGFTDGDGNVL